ncbi:rod shape-determining protein MreC [uncultured Helicobacter sp.]|uniref:rod shape-determining protein MreC n=1 Tax=uncultured Helicobacter sp. TaxID=175537 RepID=UPI00260BFF8C|nr:rod shape-determining protein MreC [uncultured Helicobacter sp.]
MKKVFLWIIFLFSVLFVSMKVSSTIQNKILFLSDEIKSGIFNLNNNVAKTIQRHFNQVEQIKQLSNSLRDKQQIEYLLEALKVEYNDLLASINSPLDLSMPGILFVRTISFVRMNNYKKIWLDYKSDKIYQNGTIFGLIDDNKVAGIAILQNHRLEGLLNGDIKCSYSVMIENKKLYGIAKYDSNKGFIVDYIPLYPKVEVGEIVRTSGNDNIFYPGILVGVVEEVELRQGYQVATIKPASDEVRRFYWMVDIENSPILTGLAEDNATKTQDILE